MAKSDTKKKKRKFKYKKIFGCLFLFAIFLVIINAIINLKIKNIYVSGNDVLTEQEVIDYAGLKHYPKIITTNSNKIIKRLESNNYIKKAKIKRCNLLFGIELIIEENTPLIYYAYDDTTLLLDGTSTKDKFKLPTLINQTPDDVLTKLLKKMNNLDRDVLIRISEIRYYPSEVDEELFFLTMDDGNYIYINIKEFKKLNNYVDIIKSFDNKKGILHLDSGDYLEIKK